MDSSLAPSERELARVRPLNLLPPFQAIVVTNARLMAIAASGQSVASGWWADEISSTSVTKGRMNAHLTLVASDGSEHQFTIKRKDASGVEVALAALTSEPNLSARSELAEGRSADPEPAFSVGGPAPLESFGTFEVWPDHLAYDGQTYPIDANTTAEVHTDVQVGTVWEGYTESAMEINFVVAHPDYAISFSVAGQRSSSQVRAIAARINAIARAGGPGPSDVRGEHASDAGAET